MIQPEPSDPPSASAAPVDTDPLIHVTGTVADTEGRSLTVTITSTSVREPTAQDRDDFASTRCGTSAINNPFGDEDTRVVTFDVEAVPSADFAGWDDGNGVRVLGTLFTGDIWEAEAHGEGGDGCYRDSVISRPGTAQMRVIASSKQWKVDPPQGDAAITLWSYGFEAQVVDALGLPTGLTEATDCQFTLSREYLELARTIVPFEEPAVPQPGYCTWGSRSYGDG